MVKGKALKKALKNPKIKKGLDKVGLGAGAATIAEVSDNPYVQAAEGAAMGAAVAGPLGAIGGGIMGYLLADQVYVLPIPMIAIPAYEAYRIQGTPSSQIYIRAGETIMPTGGNVTDYRQGVVEANALEEITQPRAKKKRKTPRQVAYGKAFKRIAPKYKLKNGKWKKDGFKRCVKEAHRIAGGKK